MPLIGAAKSYDSSSMPPPIPPAWFPVIWLSVIPMGVPPGLSKMPPPFPDALLPWITVPMILDP